MCLLTSYWELEADPSILYQLGTLLLGDHPESKVHVLEVCGCFLSLAFHGDLLRERTVANKIFQMILEMLGSSKEDIQRIPRLSQIGWGQLMSMFADIEPLHKAAKGTSTLAGLNIYRQLHLCTVFVEYYICIWLWLTDIWSRHWLLDLWLYKYLLPFISILLLHM